VVALRCFLESEEKSNEAVVLDEEEVVDVALEEAPVEDEEMHDEMMLAYESIEAELGEIPESLRVKVICESDIKAGILQELTEQEYDLVVMGAAVAHTLESDLFGSLTDAIAETLPLSVLLVRRHEPGPVNWMRRQVKEVVETATENGSEAGQEEG
jgi:nucleotide-binding universal stress UspA family protein